MNRESLSHELFLLMLNLSQVKDQRRIIQLMVEAINSRHLGIQARYSEHDSSGDPEVEQIACHGSSFGFICFSDGFAALPSEIRALLRNAVRMLAIVLENRQQAERIASERDRLEAYAQRRTAQLAESEEILRATLNSTADGILVVDNQGMVTAANPRFKEMWRIPEALRDADEDSRLLEYAISQVEDAEAFLDRIGQLYHGSEESSDEISLTDNRVFERNSCPLVIDGEQFGRVWSFRDITGRRRAEHERLDLEERLHQSNKMEAVGRLAGGIAHDFNNLLQAIRGYTDLALSAIPVEHAVHGHLLEVSKAGERATILTRQLLAFSRQEAFQRVVLDLNEMVTDLTKMLSRIIGERTDLVVHVDARPTCVYADRGQLEQALVNLCVNARDAMGDGGTLTIETKNLTWDLAECRRHPGTAAGAHVSLTVSDTGVGIDPEILSRVFEPFFTTKEAEHGTGLGLSMVYAVAERHEGIVEVDSEPEVGTTVQIVLPASQELPAVAANATPQVVDQGGTEVILEQFN